MAERVLLKIDGQVHEGWKAVSITMALNAICTVFELTLTEKWLDLPARRVVAAGAACELWIGNDLIVTGWVEDSDNSLDKSGHTITVRGRDKTCDLLDCAALHGTGTWKNVKLETIAADLLKPYGLTLKVEASTGEKIDYTIDPGESVMEALTKLARLKGLVLGVTPEGNPRLFSPKPVRADYGFALGDNISTINVTNSTADRFSQYILVGQRSGARASAENARAVKATAADPGMTRYRPLKIVTSEQSSQSGLQARARWEANAHLAAAQNVELTTPGWRSAKGTLFRPGGLVRVDAAYVNVDIDLMVTSVTLALSEDEYRTSLTLARPEAFSAEPAEEAKAKKKKKGQKVDPLMSIE
ncbi:phage baseplate assembly protein [Asticcacaulis sp. YBE204]|uniref:phage baseplate assembly protein n=1 Tax=Asticcacaulis sp. YBE204 TaxID=1282363 RepID=UPI0003C40DBE|nr:hypothetical protein [Asticcacaulis sp. YBE204]ESQ78518.1 hypothetical protein AEYBE204_13280 [Asticcacaulis sp. YBE204]